MNGIQLSLFDCKAEKLKDIMTDEVNIFKDKESAEDYIREFCKDCRPVKVKISIVGEDDE